MPIELNGQNDIVRRNGNLPDEVLASVAGPSITAEELAYLESLPPQSKLKQAYLRSTLKTVVPGFQVPAIQALVSGAGIYPPPILSSQSSYQACIPQHATNTYNFVGGDPIDNVVWVRDDTGGILRQGTTSNGWATTAGVTWSSNKGLPTSPAAVAFGGVTKLMRFKDQIYMLARDAGNLTGVYRAAPAAGNTAFSWSAALHQMSAAATALYTSMSADDSYIYLLEYGDPAAGPTAWRSADGTTWEQIYTEVGQSPFQRHGHAIMPDPYAAGHVWMTLGDANAAREILRSTDYGLTWQVIEGNAAWQAVQISFTPTAVWFAGDSARGHAFFWSRTEQKLRWASAGLARNQAVPAAAASADQFYTNGWLGIVDPATNEFYFTLLSDGAGGNTPGLFIVPYPGAAPVLVEKFGTVASPLDIFQGFLWCGRVRRPLHSVS